MNYLPIEYNTVIGSLQNITQRTFFLNIVGGNGIKVQFSNKYQSENLCLESVILGVLDESTNMVKTLGSITYKGEVKIKLLGYQEVESDIFRVTMIPGRKYVLSIYIKDMVNITSSCSTWSAKTWNTVYGVDKDLSTEAYFEGAKCEDIYPFVNEDANKGNILVGIRAVSIETKEEIKSICFFGDSITHMSYFYDACIEKWFFKYPGKFTTKNAGIGGNRVLYDATFVPDFPGNGKIFGKSGITRFEKDVFSGEKVDTVIVLEGVNDLMHPIVFDHENEKVSAQDLIDAYKEMIICSHNHGARIYLGTIMPFFSHEVQYEEAETVRNEVNAWIREQKKSDGYIDFDLTMRQEIKTSYLKEELHIGDGLHPNALGGEIMASIVPIDEIMKGK